MITPKMWLFDLNDLVDTCFSIAAETVLKIPQSSEAESKITFATIMYTFICTYLLSTAHTFTHKLFGKQ